MSSQNVISLPSIGHFVGDLAQKKVKRQSSKDARFYSGKLCFGKLCFYLSFKYMKAQKNTPPSLAPKFPNDDMAHWSLCRRRMKTRSAHDFV